MAITITLGPANADGSASSSAYAVATLTFSQNYEPGEGTLEFLVKDEAEFSALASEAQRSASRTVRRLDETIAYVNRVLGSIRKVK